MIGERAWTSGRGEFVWTQEIVDEAIAMYESILENIGRGMLYSKTIDGEADTSLMMGMNPADIEKNSEPTEALLEAYVPFGLAYEIDPATGELSMSWQGKPVHSIYDAWRFVWIANSMRGLYLGPDAVDLEAVYEHGKLTGLRETQPQQTTYGFVDSMIVDDLAGVREVQPQDVVGVATYASAGDAELERGMSFAERFEKYAPFGITYEEAEGTTGKVYYSGQFVSRFVDLTPDGGAFTFSSTEQGGITVKTVYDVNGRLTGAAPVTV